MELRPQISVVAEQSVVQERDDLVRSFGTKLRINRVLGDGVGVHLERGARSHPDVRASRLPAVKHRETNGEQRSTTSSWILASALHPSALAAVSNSEVATGRSAKRPQTTPSAASTAILASSAVTACARSSLSLVSAPVAAASKRLRNSPA